MTTVDEIELMQQALVAKYAGTFSEEDVARAVTAAQQDVEAGATIEEFVPLLVQRRAQERLVDLAGERGIELSQVQQILFIDGDNRGAALAAAAIANGRGDGLIRGRSGGVCQDPEDASDELQDLLRVRGYQSEQVEVSGLTGQQQLASDVIVRLGLTAGQQDDLPEHGLREIDWEGVTSLTGLTGEPLRAAVDELEARVDELTASLLTAGRNHRQTDPEIDREIQEALDSRG